MKNRLLCSDPRRGVGASRGMLKNTITRSGKKNGRIREYNIT